MDHRAWRPKRRTRATRRARRARIVARTRASAAPDRQSPRSSPAPPPPTAARAAAPSEVASRAPSSTDTWARSASSCGTRSDWVRPPSTRSSSISTKPLIASSTSHTRWQIASIVARATCVRSVAAVERVLRHATDRPGHGGNDACRCGASGRRSTHEREHENPRPERRLGAARHDAPRAGERGLLIHNLGPQRQLGAPALMAERAQFADAVAHSGKAGGPHPEDRAELVVPPVFTEAGELRPGRGREVRGEAGTQLCAQVGVDCPDADVVRKSLLE